MSARTWYNDAKRTSQGLVQADFSFLTNNTSNPDPDDFRGCGGETGGDGSSGTANGGPSVVSSITYDSATGKYLCTLADGYRHVVSSHASIDDASDSYQARIGAISNEGTGNTGTPVTVVVQVRDGSGTAQNSTGRRISVTLVLKNSGNGA